MLAVGMESEKAMDERARQAPCSDLRFASGPLPNAGLTPPMTIGLRIFVPAQKASSFAVTSYLCDLPSAELLQRQAVAARVVGWSGRCWFVTGRAHAGAGVSFPG